MCSAPCFALQMVPMSLGMPVPTFMGLASPTLVHFHGPLKDENSLSFGFSTSDVLSPLPEGQLTFFQKELRGATRWSGQQSPDISTPPPPPL